MQHDLEAAKKPSCADESLIGQFESVARWLAALCRDKEHLGMSKGSHHPAHATPNHLLSAFINLMAPNAPIDFGFACC